MLLVQFILTLVLLCVRVVAIKVHPVIVFSSQRECIFGAVGDKISVMSFDSDEPEVGHINDTFFISLELFRGVSLVQDFQIPWLLVGAGDELDEDLIVDP